MSKKLLVQKYCDIIRNIFLKADGGKYAVALYVIGGIPRSELTCSIFSGRLKIYNDIDILVIVKRKSIPCLLKMRQIQQIVNDGRFDFQVDLVIESAAEIMRPSPTIQNYDIQNYRKWLWGKNFYDIHQPRLIQASEIEITDALQLLFNRLGSLFIGLSELRTTSPKTEYVQVQLSKPLLAIMVALLISEKTYEGRATEQLEMICRQQAVMRSHPLWKILDDDLSDLLSLAVTFKVSPEPSHFRPLLTHANSIGKYYYQFILNFMAYVCGLPQEVEEAQILYVFRQRQPVQVDIVSTSWWVALGRYFQTGNSSVRLPRKNVHPQVDVYCEMIRWLGKYLKKTSENSNSDFAFESMKASTEALPILIAKWRNSAYGCKLS